MFAEGGDRFGLALTDLNSEVAMQETGGVAALELGQGLAGGELYSEKKYDGRRLSIRVAATFAARRGFKSCMK